MTTFEQAFRIVLGEEGGYTANPADPGNWTGGRVGVGQVHGTNFGISAKSYPTVDIPRLTPVLAAVIYQRDYWIKFGCDKLPPPLALLVFDTAVNGGHPILWLQQALGIVADGQLGPATLAAVAAHAGQGLALCARYQARHWLYLISLPTWATFGKGWAERQAMLPYLAAGMS